jgi:hypothetical protein
MARRVETRMGSSPNHVKNSKPFIRTPDSVSTGPHEKLVRFDVAAFEGYPMIWALPQAY